MKLFSSWSGGKDATFALYKIIQAQEHEVVALLNMCDEEAYQSRSHGLSTQMIQRQAACLAIPLVQQPILQGDYENSLKKVLSQFKEQGIEGGVFGDIYLEAHRQWIERVCMQMQIKAFFPLWGMDTKELLQAWIREGFKAKVVSVNEEHLPKEWLGKIVDTEFYKSISSMPHIDPCAEMGEYHTFVFDGPIFQEVVPFEEERVYFQENHWFVELK